MSKIVTSPTWVIEESEFDPERNEAWESIGTVANGYLGIRAYPEEPFEAGPTTRMISVAGVFNPGADGIEELVDVTDFLEVEITLGGRRLVLEPGRVDQYRRVLDMKRGLLNRTLVFTDDRGRRTRLEFERFASVANPHLAGQEIVVTPLNWSGQVRVQLWMNPGVRAQKKQHLRVLHAQHMARDRILMATETTESRVRVAHACRCRSWIRQTAPPKPKHIRRGQRIGLGYETYLEINQRAKFDRLVATYAGRDRETVSCERNCLQDVRNLEEAAYGVRRRRHVRRWKRRWSRADIEIDGPDEDQRRLRFAMCHLMASCPPHDHRVSIAAKGLSGPGYRGHVFWDTEIFMLPFFVATAPTAAVRLLHYRYVTLPGAKRKAREAGYEGVMFPWESTLTGDETCPPYVPDPKTGEPVRVLTGDLQQHISADVVYAAWRYCRATGNEAFRERQLFVIAVLTARFWASRVTFNQTRGQYEIHNVIGPDEYHEEIDNNAYTNTMAAWNLRVAAREVERMREVHPRSHILRRLDVGDDEIAAWYEIADNMFVPRDEASGLLEQHEGFFDLEEADPEALSARVSPDPEAVRMAKIHKAQVLKQADLVMLMVLWPEAYAKAEKRAVYDYYEPKTTHDSSLSPSFHAILAAELGRTEEAYRYFRLSARLDLADEMINTDIGLHLAGMGGTWQAVARGFLGLDLEGDRPTIDPRLPKAWKSVRTQVRHRGRWYSVNATREGGTVRKAPPRS